MPLCSAKEVLKSKLSSIPVSPLRELAADLGSTCTGSGAVLVKKLLDSNINQEKVDEFIKRKYIALIQQRRSRISDDDLTKELMKVSTFSWGVVQGQLDQLIQREYVRAFVKYDELLSKVKSGLHNDVTNYVICTWFNHWTTVLIEDNISSHLKVVPTLKNISGIDIFFDGQPFDMKVTYLPRDYDIVAAIGNPKELAIWLYEHQGAQRFGADNRFYVILLDKENPHKSWELKRNFPLVFNKIDEFFNKEAVSLADEVSFNFEGRTYTAVTKILIITN